MQTANCSPSYLASIPVEIQIMILNFILQPSPSHVRLRKGEFPLSESIVSYQVSYSAFCQSQEGILMTDHRFRYLGLQVLFENQSYAPICLRVNWARQLRLLNICDQMQYRSGDIRRSILPSFTLQTPDPPFPRIKRFILLMVVSKEMAKSLPEMLCQTFKHMIALRSVHVVAIFLPDSGSLPDWTALVEALTGLGLRYVSFSIYCIFHWFGDQQLNISALTVPSTPDYISIIESSFAYFESAKLGKKIGICTFDNVLRQISQLYCSATSPRDKTRHGEDRQRTRQY
jgi:hypothetical protein